MKTNIYLVRHAHSVYTPEDLKRPLSESGLRDAEGVTEVLLKENIEVVLASPYKRAIQTVEGIAKANGVDILIEQNFKERKLAEDTLVDFESAVEKLWSDNNFSFKGGESNKEAQRRGLEAVNKILAEYSGKNIAVGTHGNIMAIIMNYYDNSNDYDFWKKLEMPDIYKLSFENNKFIAAERVPKK